MKTLNLFVLSLFLLVGMKQAAAQTAHKIAIEHKEAAPIKEAEVKEAPKAEAIAPQVIQRTEITPVKEAEIKSETTTEVAAPPAPIEEHKAEQVEWVKTEPETPKTAPVASTSQQNGTAAQLSKLPIYRGEAKPMVRKAAMKPLVVDTTKGK